MSKKLLRKSTEILESLNASIENGEQNIQLEVFQKDIDSLREGLRSIDVPTNSDKMLRCGIAAMALAPILTVSSVAIMAYVVNTTGSLPATAITGLGIAGLAGLTIEGVLKLVTNSVDAKKDEVNQAHSTLNEAAQMVYDEQFHRPR